MLRGWKDVLSRGHFLRSTLSDAAEPVRWTPPVTGDVLVPFK